MAIGENIKEIRISQGMTQNELAAALNITQSMVAQLERGTKTLTLPLGVQLAQVLHTTLDELIKQENLIMNFNRYTETSFLDFFSHNIREDKFMKG